MREEKAQEKQKLMSEKARVREEKYKGTLNMWCDQNGIYIILITGKVLKKKYMYPKERKV